MFPKATYDKTSVQLGVFMSLGTVCQEAPRLPKANRPVPLVCRQGPNG